eukprot:COSAG01_NODE_45066_length_412_cov_186.856230_1_plen_39_part_01
MVNTERWVNGKEDVSEACVRDTKARMGNRTAKTSHICAQ